MIKNIIRHFITITKHKWVVFKLCCKAGIVWRGLVHDLSKYSPTEFIESVRYYQGFRSPITKCKEVNGYSKAWLHHKGRNKHHIEYWYDYDPIVKEIVMPYTYFAELICDNLAAGMIYNGKNWTKETQINYWRKANAKLIISPKIKKAIEFTFEEVAEKGIDEVVTSKNLKKIYNEFTK